MHSKRAQLQCFVRRMAKVLMEVSLLEISAKCRAAGSVPRCLAWRWCCCFARHQAKTPSPSKTTTTIIPPW